MTGIKVSRGYVDLIGACAVFVFSELNVLFHITFRLFSVQKDDRPAERDRKPESGFGRIPKIGDKTANRNDSPKLPDKEKDRTDKTQRDKERAIREKEREMVERERAVREKEKEIMEREKAERERIRLDKERLDRLKAERDRIDREMERLNRDRDRLDKTKSKLESKPVEKSKPVDRSKLGAKDLIRHDTKKSIDLKNQNTYRIDRNSNEKKPAVPDKSNGKYANGHSLIGKPVPRPHMPQKDGVKEGGVKEQASMKGRTEGSPMMNGVARPENGKRLPDKGVLAKRSVNPPGPSKPASNSFDFDKHVNSLKNGARFAPGDVKRKPQPDERKKLAKRKSINHHNRVDDGLVK